MSIERGNVFLAQEVEIALGKSPTVQQVIDYLMNDGTLQSRQARAHVARRMCKREIFDKKRIGTDSMKSICREIAEKLDLSWQAVYDQARKNYGPNKLG